jgi:myo-inositol-1(or 4)-monophosphatase
MFPEEPDDLFSERLSSTADLHELQPIRRVARRAVAAAARAIVAIRESGELGERSKNPRDIVTRADLEAERIALGIIGEAFPEDRFISEESFGLDQTAEQWETSQKPLELRSWVLDPIDGTVNYAHGSPLVGISLAWGYAGKVRYGIVAVPFLGLVYEGGLSAGAYCNGIPLNASIRDELSSSLIATGFPYERTALDPLLARVRKILTHCQDLRRCGAASLDLCFVAEGTFEGYVEDVQPWDMAAGLLIAQEAGAKVGWCGNENPLSLPPSLRGTGLLVAAPGVFGAMMELFGEA